MNWNRLSGYTALLGSLVVAACSSTSENAAAPQAGETDRPGAAEDEPILPSRSPALREVGIAAVAAPIPRNDVPLATPEALAAAPALPYNGGKVISNVHVVPVFWGTGVNASLRREIHCFYSAVVRSPYMDWLAEYNTPTQTIGRGTVGDDVTINPAHTGTSVSDGDIQAEISAQIDRGTLPAPDANTMYMLYFPPTVSISSYGGSCAAFCGYHNSYGHALAGASNTSDIRYGVFPDLNTGACATSCGAGTFLQNVGYASAHELIEAVTDPEPVSGWAKDAQHEIGDLCNQQEIELPGTNYTVQSMWSNSRNSCFSPTTGSAVTEPPIIDNITPATGAADGLSTFTVNGSCFAGPVLSLTKGLGTTVPALSASPTSITFSTTGSPDHTVGTASLLLHNTGSQVSLTSSITFVQSPTVLGTTSGPMQGGVPVIVRGGPYRVGSGTVRSQFGGISSTILSQCDSTTSCTIYPPPHDPGTVPVTLTVDGVNESVSGAFTYLGPQITSVSPASGPISGGTAVTIEATNMAPTSLDSFVAPATLGGFSIGNVSCFRSGSIDASCSFVTPARTSLPAGPLDIQITVTHTTGSRVPTAIAAADRFTYTQLPALTSFSFIASASGGQTADGLLSLSGDAPSGNAQVALSLAPGVPAGIVQLPPNVVVPAGQASVRVPLLVTNQNFTGDVAIVASYAGTFVTGTLRVYPTSAPSLSALSSLCAGQTAVETITLTEPAPPGGGVVKLAVDDPAASVPASVTVPAGATSVTFNVTAASPATAKSVHLSASYYGLSASPTVVSVLPSSGVMVSLPASVIGRYAADGTISLCSPAPAGGANVAVTSDNTLAIPPASVTVPAGSTSTAFTVATHQTTSPVSATVTATYQGNTASARLGIKSSSVVTVTCPTNQTLCTCASGAHTCVTSAAGTQCLLFCQKH